MISYTITDVTPSGPIIEGTEEISSSAALVSTDKGSFTVGLPEDDEDGTSFQFLSGHIGQSIEARNLDMLEGFFWGAVHVTFALMTEVLNQSSVRGGHEHWIDNPRALLTERMIDGEDLSLLVDTENDHYYLEFEEKTVGPLTFVLDVKV